MLQKFIDYIKELNILNDEVDIDFSDLSFAYDYNEVQELFFDDSKNNYAFIVGETGLRKKDMLARICKDLSLRGVEKQDMLYLDYELPILHGEDILPMIHEFYLSRRTSEYVYLIINEIQQYGNWFLLVQKLRADFPKLKLLCSSSTPPYIFETVYDNGAEYCKIVVLSQKNASNIKYKSQSFGVFEEFKYNQKDGIIEIKGLTKEGKKMPRHTVPETINGLPVKIIASGAFHDRVELLSISLPDGIEMIGDYAFSKCANLKQIRLPKALTYIGEHAFLGAQSLSDITGGADVVHVGNSAFYDTEWLKNQHTWAIVGKTVYKYLGKDRVVELPKGIKTVAGYAFADSAVEEVMANGDVTVGEGAFYNCRQLRKTNITFSSLPPFAFYGCKNLIAQFNIDAVGKFGLYGCSSVSGIVAKNLGECALAHCTNVKQVNGVRTILQGALWNCGNLSYSDFSKVQHIGDFALGKTALREFDFAGGKLGDFALFNCANLSAVKLKPEVFVGRGVFYKCGKINSMDVSGKTKLKYYFAGEQPKAEELIVRGCIIDDFNRNNPHLKSLTVIGADNFGRWSFYNNSSLKTVKLYNLKRIGDWAFAYCDGITAIELPRETEYIGMNAFRYCHNLSEIKISADVAVPFGANAFYSTAEEKRFIVRPSAFEGYSKLSIWQEYMKNLKAE